MDSIGGEADSEAQTGRRRHGYWWLLAANMAGVLTALALIWGPELALYWVGPTQVPEASLEQARSRPSLAVLAEIADQPLIALIDAIDIDNPARLRELGEDVLAGRVKLAGRPVAMLPFPFRPSHLDTGSPSHALQVASLGTVRVLLGAYTATREQRFLDAALKETVAFDRVDAWRVVPRGLLWNDHAIAGRVPTLVLLWSMARQKPDLDPSTARAVLELADRTGARLAKPELYNSRTNHGVMQDVGLIQLAVAFPTLPRADHYRQIACTRLVEHMRYYIDSEGPVLEHSAGYHELGRDLLVKAIRLFEMAGCVVPAEWRGLLERVNEFSHLLQRPDRTLPVYGNTDHAPLTKDMGVDVAHAPLPRRVYDVAGFAIGWRGIHSWPDPAELSQTTITWSNFPTRAHKHADDMAITVWSGGRAWITNSGYWPYGVEGFDAANGWRGSNAPHFQGESPRSPRETVLIGTGESSSVSAIDIERRTTNQLSVRRQIIEIAGKAWVVLDSAKGGDGKPLESLWTLMPDTKVQAVGERELLLESPMTAESARMFFFGPLATALEVRRGSLAPFGGWIVMAGRPIVAPAIDVRRRAESPVAMVLALNVPAGAVRLEEGQEPTRWKVTVAGGKEGFVAQRSENILSVQFGDGRSERLDFTAPADTQTRRRKIVSAYEAAAREFPGVRELTYYRYRLTILALALLIAQELVIAASWKLLPAAVRPLRVAATLSWVGLGLVATLWYLR